MIARYVIRERFVLEIDRISLTLTSADREGEGKGEGGGGGESLACRRLRPL